MRDLLSITAALAVLLLATVLLLSALRPFGVQGRSAIRAALTMFGWGALGAGVTLVAQGAAL